MVGKLIEQVEQTIIAIGLAAATLLLFMNVVARYLFDTGFPWILETVQYLFAWVVLVGAAYGFKTGVHLGIDILVEKFSPAVRRWCALLALALTLGFAGQVLLLAIDYTMMIREWGDLTLDLQIPQWIPYTAIPVGLSLMIYHLLEVGWLIWIGERTGIHANEAAEHLQEVKQ